MRGYLVLGTRYRRLRGDSFGEGGGGFGGAEAVEIKVDDRGSVEREELGEEQAADDGDAQGAAELGPHAGAKGERQSAQQRGAGRHHDRSKAQQASLEDRFVG